MDHPTLSPDELHLLYILLDSNLPTGGFVSSSGLEAYVKHGFLGIVSSSSPYSIDADGAGTGVGTFTAVKGVKDVIRGVTDFAEAEVGHYGSTTGCFVKDSWTAVHQFMSAPYPKMNDSSNTITSNSTGPKGHDKDNQHVEDLDLDRGGRDLSRVMGQITQLDAFHESSMLSHVARRASKAQGVAMLTLFSRGLSRPVGFEPSGSDPTTDINDEDLIARLKEERSMSIVAEYKRLVRKGVVPGHLAVCWGVITATLGLALDRSIHLYLFLHARSLLSTAVRMNIIGPYASSQMLLHPFKRIIEIETDNLTRGEATTGLFEFDFSYRRASTNIDNDTEVDVGGDEDAKMQIEVDGKKREERSAGEDDFWSWTTQAELGPATTWPLGELLMARHDMQHSRIFNS